MTAGAVSVFSNAEGAAAETESRSAHASGAKSFRLILVVLVRVVFVSSFRSIDAACRPACRPPAPPPDPAARGVYVSPARGPHECRDPFRFEHRFERSDALFGRRLVRKLV